MEKLQSLRNHLLAAPLKIQTENLHVFGIEGEVLSYNGSGNAHFQIKYKAEIIITDFSGKLCEIGFVLLNWLAVNEPDYPSKPFTFEAEPLSNHGVDLSFTVPLSETIKTEQTEAGISLKTCSEPDLNTSLLPAGEWQLDIQQAE